MILSPESMRKLVRAIADERAWDSRPAFDRWFLGAWRHFYLDNGADGALHNGMRRFRGTAGAWEEQ